MPQVPLKFIVSFSSQDPRHPAESILSSDGAKRWLSCATDRTGQLHGIIQLDRMCTISTIDIGVCLAFTVEVQVGRSTWPAGHQYVTLLSNTPFMTLLECRREKKSKTSLRMFNKEHFSKESQGQKWDRIKIICSQPYRKDVQMGISLLRVTTDDDARPTLHMLQNKSESYGSSNTVGSEGTPSDKPLSSTDFHRHFFGNTPQRSKQKEELKNNLTKIAASVENCNAQDVALSRNAKLVLAANSSTPKYKKSSEPEPPQAKSTATPKRRLSFDDEAQMFLNRLDVKNMDMESLTFADLRHKFEKQKLRKLSKEERKIFFTKAQILIEKAIVSQDSETKVETSVNPVIADRSTAWTETNTSKYSGTSGTNSDPDKAMSGSQSGMGFATSGNNSRQVTQNTAVTPNRKNQYSVLGKGKCTSPVTLHAQFSPTVVNKQSPGMKRKLSSPDEAPKKRFSLDGSCSVAENTVTAKQRVGVVDTPDTRGAKLSRGRGRGDVGQGRGDVGRGRTPRGGSTRGRGSAARGGHDRGSTTPGGRGRGSTTRGRGRGRESPAEQSAPLGSVDLTDEGPDGVTLYVTCPLCNCMFPSDTIEAHATWCRVEVHNNSDTDDDDYGSSRDDQGQCPLCGSFYPIHVLIGHAELCAGSHSINVT